MEWVMGYSSDLGDTLCGISGNIFKGLPYDSVYEWDYYKVGSGWIHASVDDISVQCVGKYHLILMRGFWTLYY